MTTTAIASADIAHFRDALRARAIRRLFDYNVFVASLFIFFVFMFLVWDFLNASVATPWSVLRTFIIVNFRLIATAQFN